MRHKHKKLKNFKSVISIIEYEDPIEISMRYNKSDGRIKPIFKNLLNNKTNSRFIKKSYRPSGGFYMSYRRDVLKNKSFFSKRNCAGILYSNTARYVDINSLSDFKYASYMLKT